jgi:electron transport complex protein RnfB
VVALRILYAFASVAGLGLLLGVGLAFASRLLAVKKNEKIVVLEEALPGLNCGACGYAGCSSYAEAIAGDEEVSLSLCAPGGAETAQRLAEIMGVEVSASLERRVAQVHCRGGRDAAKYAFEYQGIQDCNALYALYGGNKVCKYGCLGLGSCIAVCPVGAIDTDDQGLVRVDPEKCISCGKCLEVCPTGVMRWVPYDADFIVACNSRDKGRDVRKYCSVGCIACKMCEKKSPEGGFLVEDNLARIDYNQKGERESAASACPTKCIINNGVQTPEV